MQLQQIAERCQQGDREAFALLYTAMHQPLRKSCLRYVNDETVADDLVHDAFLIILSKISTLKDTTRVEAWMTMVMQRVALLYLRQQKQRHQVELTEADLVSAPQGTDGACLSEILAAVDALPDGYRKVFRLSVIEGMNHQEIAELLHIEPHSSSSQLYHAKVLLRRWLRPMVLLLLAIALQLGIYHWLGRYQHEDTPPLASSENGKSVSSTDKWHERSTDAAATREETAEANDNGRGGRRRDVATAKPDDDTGKDGAANNVESPERPDNATHNDEQREVTPYRWADEEPSKLSPSKWPAGPRNSGRTAQWDVQLAYSGMGNSSHGQLPYANPDINTAAHDSLASHHLPITVSLSVNYRIDSHWRIGTGLGYTRLSSEFNAGNNMVSLQQQQTVNYLDIPICASYHWQLSHRWQLYVSANASMHLPLSSTLDSHYLLAEGIRVDRTTERLHPGLQWSTGMGVGLLYNLTPHVGFFIEPGLNYYMRKSDSGVKTWNTEHPIGFSVPLGVRITLIK